MLKLMAFLIKWLFGHQTRLLRWIKKRQKRRSKLKNMTLVRNPVNKLTQICIDEIETQP